MIKKSDSCSKPIRTKLPILDLRQSNYKFNLKVKLTYVCIFVAILNLQANGTYSQNTKVSLNHENVTTESVLDSTSWLKKERSPCSA